MKVRTHRKGYPGQEHSLADFLEPVYTGSEQGSIEQLNAEIRVLKTSFGAMLARMVERNTLTFDEALEISGKHKSFIEYRYGELELIP